MFIMNKTLHQILKDTKNLSISNLISEKPSKLRKEMK